MIDLRTAKEGELLPCPFCGGPAKDIVGLIGCEPCAIGRRDAASWNRRALPKLPGEGDVPFQARVHEWILACFGPEIGADRIERNHRFIEEALELVQANGCTASEAHQLVAYVFGRPLGDPVQEVGGVMNTLAALCTAIGIDLNAAGETELARVWTKVEAIRAKQAAKPKHSPLPELPSTPTNAEATREEVAVEDARKYHNGLFAMTEKIKAATHLQQAREYAHELKVELGAWSPPPTTDEARKSREEASVIEACRELRKIANSLSDVGEFNRAAGVRKAISMLEGRDHG